MKVTAKLLYIWASFLVLFNLLTQSAFAVDAPNFPNCPNPGGSIIAQYDTGTHGVPADGTSYTGQDKVFKISDTQVVQCLCPDSGSGVQTLWWKSPGISDADKSVLFSQGWTRIPNGKLWGLDEGEYFAKNSTFVCGGVGGGSVLGTSIGRVLGYATTGTAKDSVYISLGFVSLLSLSLFVYKIMR